MTRIAFLGLGEMGRRMAGRLLAAGHELVVWNRTPGAAAALLAAGARAAPTPRAAADGAQVVWSMVFDDAASRRVWLDDATGAAASLRPGVVAIESGTLTPAWVQSLAGTLAGTGAAFLDAPVAGSRPQADAGQLVFLAGGEAAALESVRPLLAVLGPAVHHVGPAGSGAWLKLAVNALFATQVGALAEQLELLRRAGLDLPTALAAMRALPVMSAAAGGAAALMLADDFTPQAPVDLIAKDLAYALDAGAAAGASLPVTAAVRGQFMAAQAAGWGAANLVAVVRLLR